MNAWFWLLSVQSVLLAIQGAALFMYWRTRGPLWRQLAKDAFAGVAAVGVMILIVWLLPFANN